MKQAQSYTQEHLNDQGLYELTYFKDDSNLLRLKMQSRHTRSKSYQLWLKYDENEVIGWYCQCKTGARTIGCCAHIAAVIWYLSYYRYAEQKQLKTADYDNYVVNATEIAEVDNSDNDSFGSNEEL